MATATMGSPMTRDEALRWCADHVREWPSLPALTPTLHPSGWEWVRSSSNNWYLHYRKPSGGSEAILESDWCDAKRAAAEPHRLICGVSAIVGERYKVKISQGEFIGTLAGTYGERSWFVDCSGAITGFALPDINQITGFAPQTERDEFIERAADVMFQGNPSMSRHVARLNAASVWDAGARFTDTGEA